MSTDRQRRIEELFDELVDAPPADQRRLLDMACGGDVELASELSALLDADARSHPILGHDAGRLASALLDAGDEAIVSGRVGRYIVQQYLGEGGMSWVYLAKREDLGDLVALKFLHALWSSPGDRRRFAREQMTLAGLNHRYIARLYDAGVTDGTPWFAMEYVKGVSIIAHCERQALGVRDRLRLFRDACEAVTYAHRKLTVHLDLKPSNVLVTDEGDVKLLDFGIAQNLTQDGRAVDATAMTRRLLSLNYASPEQIAGEPLDVQADVYSLGALLYQLLTGTVPVDLTGVSAANLAEALQRDVRRPSTRADATSPVHASRAEWRELDALCGKALSRDKAFRYQSVDRLTADVDRFLAHQPLEASIDRYRYYRLRKFLWRHRRAAAAAAAVAVTISALVIFFNVRLIAARDEALSSEARTERIHRLMLNLFEGDDAAAGPAEGLRVVALLDRGVRDATSLRTDPELQSELNSTFGGLYHKLGHLDRAEPLLRSALQTRQQLSSPDHPQTIRPRLALALLRLDQSQVDAARSLVNEAVAVARRHYASDSVEVATAEAVLGKVFVTDGQYEQGLPLLEKAVRILAKAPGSVELSEAMGDLANGLYYVGRIDDSEVVNRHALKLDEEVFGERHPHVGVDLFNLGNIELDHARYAAAEALYRRALTINEDWYGAQHPKAASTVLMLGRALAYQGRLGEAAPLYQRALETFQAVYGEHNVRFASVLSLMGDLARERRQIDESRRLFERSAAIFKETAGEKHEFYLHQLSNLGSVELASGRYQQAEQMLRAAVSGLTAAVPAQRYTGLAEIRLGAALAGQKAYAEAARHAETGYGILVKVASPGSVEVQNARAVLIGIYAGLNEPDKQRDVEEASRRYGGLQADRK